MQNFKEVLLVVNPISGDVSKDKIKDQVKDAVEAKRATFHLYETTGEDDAQKIQQKIKEKNIDRVIIAGGDGTINLVGDAIKDYELEIGLIPAGSANGLCTNLQIPQQTPEQIEIALGDNFIKIDMLCLNDHLCLHLSDLGVNAELIRNYEGSKIRGKFGYLLQTIPTLIKSEYPFEFSVSSEESDTTHSGVLLAVANFKKYGTGANVNPIGKPNDGIFEILIFKRLNVFDILKTLRNETEPDPEFIEIIQTKKSKITCKKPIAFQVDGEYLGEETEIDVKLLPEKLKIAIPHNLQF